MSRILLAAGRDHSLLGLADGSLFGFGGEGSGRPPEPADEQAEAQAVAQLCAPAVDVTAPAASDITTLRAPAALAAGFGFSLALDAKGQAFGWGTNRTGQIGPEPGFHVAPTPVRGLVPLTDIAAGEFHALGLDAEGQVWGLGRWGDPAAPPTTRGQPQRLDLPPIQAIACGQAFSVALDEDGAVWAWGANGAGVLGPDAPRRGSGKALRVPGLPAIRAIAAGSQHVLALDHQGRVWTWGGNAGGQLGPGSVGAHSATPHRLPGLSGIVEIDAGSDFSMARDEAGRLHLWGLNALGQLADPDAPRRRPEPQTVTGLPKITGIRAGQAHALAVDNSGGVWAWGANQLGQIGDGTRFARALPTRVFSPKQGWLNDALGQRAADTGGWTIIPVADSRETADLLPGNGWRVVFFGYTHCPDVCPTTLARLAVLTEALENTSGLTFQFCTVDPERDGAEHLGNYVRHFAPRIEALRLPRMRLNRLVAALGTGYRYTPAEGGRYWVEHSTYGFVIDDAGRLRFAIPDGYRPARVADDLKRLINDRGMRA
ncbi:MAG: SCO family protein [Halothiobacillaceae bacterium]